MVRQKGRVWKIIAYVFVIVIFLGLIIISNKERESTVVETVLSYTVLPIQRGFSYVGIWLGGYKDAFPQMDQLKQQNKELEKENDELKEKLANYNLINEENKELKQQLNLSEKYPAYNTVVAQVIAEDINNWYQIILINQGSKAGIKPGMTVISDKGLVGYIKEVSEDTSKVLCITDSGNSVSGRVTKTKETVVCRGEIGLKEKSQLKLIYIPTDVVLSKGDLVETSGLGGVYKKGIQIGEIVDVVESTNNLESYAIVQTAVDFSTLEYVLVVLD